MDNICNLIGPMAIGFWIRCRRRYQPYSSLAGFGCDCIDLQLARWSTHRLEKGSCCDSLKFIRVSPTGSPWPSLTTTRNPTPPKVAAVEIPATVTQTHLRHGAQHYSVLSPERRAGNRTTQLTVVSVQGSFRHDRINHSFDSVTDEGVSSHR